MVIFHFGCDVLRAKTQQPESASKIATHLGQTVQFALPHYRSKYAKNDSYHTAAHESIHRMQHSKCARLHIFNYILIFFFVEQQQEQQTNKRTATSRRVYLKHFTFCATSLILLNFCDRSLVVQFLLALKARIRQVYELIFMIES